MPPRSTVYWNWVLTWLLNGSNIAILTKQHHLIQTANVLFLFWTYFNLHSRLNLFEIIDHIRHGVELLPVLWQESVASLVVASSPRCSRLSSPSPRPGAQGLRQATTGRARPGPRGPHGMAAISRYCFFVRALMAPQEKLVITFDAIAVVLVAVLDNSFMLVVLASASTAWGMGLLNCIGLGSIERRPIVAETWLFVR